MFCNQTTLDTGVSVVTERIEGVRSVALGFWVRCGNRDELEGEYGMSHFMEHLLFKGTAKRSALDISATADALGAELNAFTSREYTCFYARVIDEHADEMFEVLSDMIVDARLKADDIELEREVVIEEIARSEDTPEDHVFDLFAGAFMPTHPLGRPVLGTRASVSALSQEALHAYRDAHYTTGNITVVACGNVDHEHIVGLADRWLEKLPTGARLARVPQEEPARKRCAVQVKKTEQAHMICGYPSVSAQDPKRYALSLLSSAMGGGMSSRLFQEIREKRGLAYSVYCVNQLFEDAGVFALYAGSRPENLSEVLSLARAECLKVAREGVSDEELARAKGAVRGNFVLGMESTSARMLRLGRMAVSGLPFLSVDETLERYEAVSRAEVNEAAAHLFSAEPTVGVISPYSAEEVEGMLA